MNNTYNTNECKNAISTFQVPFNPVKLGMFPQILEGNSVFRKLRDSQ